MSQFRQQNWSHPSMPASEMEKNNINRRAISLWVPCVWHPHHGEVIAWKPRRLSRELGLNEKLFSMARQSLSLRGEILVEKQVGGRYANETFTLLPKLPPETQSIIRELAVAPELHRPNIHTILKEEPWAKHQNSFSTNQPTNFPLPPNLPRVAHSLPSILKACIPNVLQPRTRYHIPCFRETTGWGLEEKPLSPIPLEWWHRTNSEVGVTKSAVFQAPVRRRYCHRLKPPWRRPCEVWLKELW